MNEENQYTDIDALTNRTNQMYENAYKQQQDIINKQTQQNIAELERNKQEVQEETDKTNKALYTEYQKQVNPYGYEAEVLASQGLNKSGVSESTRTNMYNTYQNNRTNTINTATKAKADFDVQISKARENGDIQLAQAALDMYNQQIENLYNEYNLRQNREQYLYQKNRDAISDAQWEKEYQYQLDRDAIEDKRYEREWNYNTTKNASSKSNGTYNYLTVDDNNTKDKQTTEDELYQKLINELVGSKNSNLKTDPRTDTLYKRAINSPVSSIAINKLLLGRS